MFAICICVSDEPLCERETSPSRDGLRLLWKQASFIETLIHYTGIVLTPQWTGEPNIAVLSDETSTVDINDKIKQ